MGERPALEVGDDLLDDRVAAVGGLRLEHRQRRVREHRVVSVDGEQRVLIVWAHVRDPADNEPRGRLQRLGLAVERGEGNLGDLSLTDPLLRGLVPDRVGVLDRGPRIRRDRVDGPANRGSSLAVIE